MELLDRVRTSVLVADGAMGTQLQLAGLAIGGGGEAWNVEHPDQVLAIHHAYLAAELAAAAGLPVMVQPNAGQPRLEGARAVYDMSGDGFADGMRAVLSAGAAVVGGCCGTGPEHIRALRALVDSWR